MSTDPGEQGPGVVVPDPRRGTPIRSVPLPFGEVPNGAVVEIVDSSVDPCCLVPRRVLVNGVDVGLIADGGMSVDGNWDTAVTVTLKLLPSRVEFRGAYPDDPPVPLRSARPAQPTA